MPKYKHSNRLNVGFQLIELIVVIAIIAILAPLGYIGYQKVYNNAKVSYEKNNIWEIASNMAMAYTDNQMLSSEDVVDVDNAGVITPSVNANYYTDFQNTVNSYEPDNYKLCTTGTPGVFTTASLLPTHETLYVVVEPLVTYPYGTESGNYETHIFFICKGLKNSCSTNNFVPGNRGAMLSIYEANHNYEIYGYGYGDSLFQNTTFKTAYVD